MNGLGSNGTVIMNHLDIRVKGINGKLYKVSQVYRLCIGEEVVFFFVPQVSCKLIEHYYESCLRTYAASKAQISSTYSMITAFPVPQRGNGDDCGHDDKICRLMSLVSLHGSKEDIFVFTIHQSVLSSVISCLPSIFQ